MSPIFGVGNAANIPGMKNDFGIGKISLESANFHVTFLPDDDGLKSYSEQTGKFGVGYSDERAGRVGDPVSGLMPAMAVLVRSAMCGDHHFRSGSGGAFEFAGISTLLVESGFDEWIVGELA